MSRGAEPREAKLHEGASEPAVDTCLISAVAIRKAPSSPNDCRWPVWNTGCLCGNEYCRLCRSKTIRSAQRGQHGSMTEPTCKVVYTMPRVSRGMTEDKICFRPLSPARYLSQA